MSEIHPSSFREKNQQSRGAYLREQKVVLRRNCGTIQAGASTRRKGEAAVLSPSQIFIFPSTGSPQVMAGRFKWPEKKKKPR